MNARSALFDLYGDHLRTRGRSVPIASPVRLTAGNALTAEVVRRLDEARRRIYRDTPDTRDGRWHLLPSSIFPT